MRIGSKLPDVLAVDNAPIIQFAGVAKLDEGGQVPRVVGVCVRGEIALDGHVAPELRYTVNGGRIHRQIRLSIWPGRDETSAPTRPRSGPPYAPGTLCSCQGGSGRDLYCPTRADRCCPYPPAEPVQPSQCHWRPIRTGTRAANHAPVRNVACHS